MATNETVSNNTSSDKINANFDASEANEEKETSTPVATTAKSSGIHVTRHFRGFADALASTGTDIVQDFAERLRRSRVASFVENEVDTASRIVDAGEKAVNLFSKENPEISRDEALDKCIELANKMRTKFDLN